MKQIINKDVSEKFNSYPESMRKKLMFLRKLVFDTASEIDDVDNIEETLKWGEPSYHSNIGSTIRIDWKESTPEQYAMYFHCKTKLIDTCKELYHETFKFEGNRAIIFNENDDIPIAELKHCIFLALTYQRRKHLWMLGE